MTASPLELALSAVITEWFQPFNIVLFVGIILVGYYLYRANQRADFALVDMLRGDDGKASMGRFGYLIALIAGTVAILQCAATWQQKPEQFVDLFGIYMLVLIAPKVLDNWIQSKYSRKEDH